MMQDQKDTKDLVQKLVDQCPPHHLPCPPEHPERPDRPDREGARRTVEDLLGRILNALGLPSECPPSRVSTPESEGSNAEKPADELPAAELRHITRTPIAEPQPLRPSSERNLEEWELYRIRRTRCTTSNANRSSPSNLVCSGPHCHYYARTQREPCWYDRRISCWRTTAS